MILAFGLLGLIGVSAWLIVNYRTDEPLPPPQDCIPGQRDNAWIGRKQA